jgi:flagellin
VVAKDYGKAAAIELDSTGDDLSADKIYVVTTALSDDGAGDGDEDQYGTVGTLAAGILALTSESFRGDNSDGTTTVPTGAITDLMEVGDVLVANAAIGTAVMDTTIVLKEVLTGENAFVAGQEYVIRTMGDSTGVVDLLDADNGDAKVFNDATAISRASSDIADGATLTVGTTFTVDADASVAELAHLNSLTEGMTFSLSTDALTKDIEAIQGLVNTARVQAGSQYAALESAVNYTTDLTAQYELGYNTVNDVNFSMETAHLAKNQILQQAATAMLAQANSGQQGLLQLIN